MGVLDDPLVQATSDQLGATLTHLLPKTSHLRHNNHLANAVLDAFREHARAHGTQNGHAVIAMAGPPGAGKTTALANPTTRKLLQTGNVDTYITIDADDIKNVLLGIGDPHLHIDQTLLTAASN